MTTDTPCERCGTFLAAGRVRLCEPCERRAKQQLEIGATARLTAICLFVSAAMLMSMEAAAMVRGKNPDYLQMAVFGLQTAFGPLFGAVGVLWRRSPGPVWAGIALMAVCPSNWIWLMLGDRMGRLWGTIFALAGVAALLAIALSLKLRRQRRAAGASEAQ